jgi:Ca2+-dependent lipid-binding protein
MAMLTPAQTLKADPSQSKDEYKRALDLTAPPDPVAEGSTSDVPIQGEKTNVLFYPTPSKSFAETGDRMEKQASTLCIAVFFAIVVLGKLFGGALKGLIPLGACVASAMFLWMKEAARSAKEVEWSAEQARGQVAVASLLPESVEWMNRFLEVLW